jgi:methylamine--corrinoid protein Co-methyltransferase
MEMFSYADFLEVLDRAESGPLCAEKDWNMKVLPGIVRQKVAEHGLLRTFNRDQLVPSDDNLADEVFKAGLEVAVEAGVLCISTERRIMFTESELKEVLRDAPSEITVGRDTDEVSIKHRRPEDTRPTVAEGGPIGDILSQELFVPVCYSYVKERSIDVFDGPTLDKVYGRRIRAASPTEGLAGILDIVMLREACVMAGRKGMPVVGIETSPTSIGQLTGANPEFGFYPTDIQLVGFLAELKTNWNQLNKVVNAIAMGGNILGYGNPLFGGYVGGPEACAVTLVAVLILACAVHGAKLPMGTVTDARTFGNSIREAMWAQNLAHMAMSRNTHVLNGGAASPVAGCCTEMLLYETAASIIGDVTVGTSLSAGTRTGGGKIANACSGLEGRFHGELCKVVPKSGLKRQVANEVVLELVKKYEDKLMNPPKGKLFTECYDIPKIKPSSEWLEIYSRVKKELEDLGVDFERMDTSA